MKKIKITEKQAELLGLHKITESEDGVKSVGTSIGEAIVRIVISGPSLPKFKDRIIQLITRQDNTANVNFFEQTGKIVGNVKGVKLDSIKRDISVLDSSIVVEKKPIAKSLKEGVKNIVKISKEQYNRIFASQVINEDAPVKVTGGLNRVDKSFKKAFAGSDVQDLTSSVKTSESKKFDIKKHNKSVPKLTLEGEKEEVAEDPLKAEVIELVKYLYRKNEKLSPFWEQNGMDFDAIVDTLLAKNMIVPNGGRYELAKTLGNPQAALQAVEDTLRAHVKPQGEPELETEDAGGYPAGAEHDSAAPWNQQEPDTTTATKPKHIQLTPIAFNREICLFKGPDGAMYVFYHDNIDKKELMQYASLTRHYVGKDEDGQPEYDYDEDFDIDADVISNYVNDNIQHLSKGEGAEAYEQGVDLVKIDDALKSELLSMYDKDKKLVSILNPIDEGNFEGAMSSLKANLAQAATPSDKPKIPQSKIVAKLAELKAKEEERRKAEQAGIDAQSAAADEVDEMTGASSSGAFTGPMGGAGGGIITREMPDTPVVGETTTVASVGGQYDTPGLANVGRNGEFKKGPAPKAFKTSQYPDGQMVKQPECSKLNNNKSAQNGGCNQGASTQKYKKASGSVISPSLAENEIYEAIAVKTGKTIDEVKRIIESKNKKA